MMAVMQRKEPDPGRTAGCVSMAGAWVLLILLAPFAAAASSWRRLRRGAAPRVGWVTGTDGRLATIDLRVDIPSATAARARRDLVDAVVRIAEKLRRPDDVYNMIWREAGESAASLTAVGPKPHELAEELDTSLSHRVFDRRTQLWMTLPRGVFLAELVDPLDFEPEADDAATELFGRLAPRWAMEISYARSSPSTLYRVIFHVPEEASGAVCAILERFRARLHTSAG